MKVCTRCKKISIDELTYCPACGGELKTKKNAKNSNSRRCSRCGSINENGAYCLNCGQDLFAGIDKTSKKNAKNIALIVIIIAAFVIVGVIASILIFGFVNKTSSGSNVLEEETIDFDDETQVLITQNSQIPIDSPDIIVEETKQVTPFDDVVIEETKTKPQQKKPKILRAVTLTGQELGSSNISSTRRFDASQAIDGNPESCWCVNTAKKGGLGARIKFELKNSSSVSGVKIINGNIYSPQDRLYENNGQIKNFTLYFSDGSSKSFAASFNNATADYEYFTFGETVVTDYIILVVGDGYPGFKFGENVCIGEFDVY